MHVVPGFVHPVCGAGATADQFVHASSIPVTPVMIGDLMCEVQYCTCREGHFGVVAAVEGTSSRCSKA